MTEHEWLTCADPTPMLAFLRGEASDRGLRLFAVAYCRRLWCLLRDDRSRKALECVEAFADGAASDVDRIASARAAHSAKDTAAHASPTSSTTAAARLAYEVIRTSGNASASNVVYYATMSGVSEGEAFAQTQLFRCIFGNPFRPVTADPAWFTPTAVSLAEAIYADRAFDRLPILADALEEAGCDNAEVLTHCRSDGPHVRGCWVVDLVLGKE